MRSDDVSSPTSGGGLEALLIAAKLLEEQDEEKEEYEFIRLNEILAGKDVPSAQENNGSPFTHDHTYTFLKQEIRDIKNSRKKKDKNMKACFRECHETLSSQLPLDIRDEKTYTIVIHNAVWNIASLQREGKQFEEEVEKLTIKNLAFKHELSVLEDELIAHSENVDLNNEAQAIFKLGSKPVTILDYNSFSFFSGNYPLQLNSVTFQAQILESLRSSLQSTPVRPRRPTCTIIELPDDTPLVQSHISDDARVEDNNRDSNCNILPLSKHSTGDKKTFRMPLMVVPRLSDPFILPNRLHSADLNNFTQMSLQQPHLLQPATSASEDANNSV